MKCRWPFQLLIVSGVMASVGCYPALVTKVPRITGRIVDSNHDPVTGATIAVGYASHRPLAEIGSGETGHFQLKPRADWMIAPLVAPLDLAAPTLRVYVILDGKERDIETLHAMLLQTRPFGFGDVESVHLGDIIIGESAEHHDGEP